MFNRVSTPRPQENNEGTFFIARFNLSSAPGTEATCPNSLAFAHLRKPNVAPPVTRFKENAEEIRRTTVAR